MRGSSIIFSQLPWWQDNYSFQFLLLLEENTVRRFFLVLSNSNCLVQVRCWRLQRLGLALPKFLILLDLMVSEFPISQFSAPSQNTELEHLWRIVGLVGFFCSNRMNAEVSSYFGMLPQKPTDFGGVGRTETLKDFFQHFIGPNLKSDKVSPEQCVCRELWGWEESCVLLFQGNIMRR